MFKNGYTTDIIKDYFHKNGNTMNIIKDYFREFKADIRIIGTIEKQRHRNIIEVSFKQIVIDGIFYSIINIHQICSDDIDMFIYYFQEDNEKELSEKVNKFYNFLQNFKNSYYYIYYFL